MLIAITGASGFIGSYIARTLHSAGHEIRSLVRERSRRDHIASAVSDWCVGEIHDHQALAALVAGADVVVHNAVDWDALERSPITNIEHNVVPSLRLLEAARVAGVQQFQFVSSGATYYEILKDRPLDENHPTWPDTIYGAYKASIEPHLKAYHVQFGLHTTSWRPVAVYGVDPAVERSQWYALIQKVKRGEPIDIAKGGKITHVQDIADAIRYAITDPETAGEFYNLVDRHIYWQQVAEIAMELTGSASTITDRKGSGPKNQYDTRKAVAYFDRHNNSHAIRRGLDGVREYVEELLKVAI